MNLGVFSILVLLGGLFGGSNQMGTCPNDYKGSTPEIESIFVGRCSYFVNILHSADCDIQKEKFNCSAIWAEFSGAILNKEPCNVTMSSFDPLFRISNHPIKPNTTLFWSGTNNLAHEISRNSEYNSMEDTLIGYSTNELLFCSAANQNYFSNTSCPDECVTWNNPFWNAASVNFASHASGYTLAVLNGTRPAGAFSNTSTFFRYELPNLDADRVYGLKVLLLHQHGQDKYETCAQPKTLGLLETLLKEKGLKYECEDDSFEILLLMCNHNPLSRECQAIKYALGGDASSTFAYSRFLILAHFLLTFISLHLLL